jgi:hypothetical protein
MANSIDPSVVGWDVLRAFSVVWLVLTLILTAMILPPWFFPATILMSIACLLCASLAVLKGRSTWAVGALLMEGALFSLSLISTAVSNLVPGNFPSLLFVFVMILFEVEMLRLLSRHYELFSMARTDSEFGLDPSILRRSLRRLLHSFASYGVIFAACYALTICAVYVGSVAASYVSFLSDISLYVVATSVALALIIILREEH